MRPPECFVATVAEWNIQVFGGDPKAFAQVLKNDLTNLGLTYNHAET
jgi:hypothetical protein